MRKFCEHCYTEYTAQTQCPYCAARPGLQAHLAQGAEHLRQQKEKLETLRQDAAKGRSFGFLLWIIPAVLWMWLMSKAEVHPEEGMSAEAVALLMTVITYVVPSILCAGLMVLGFFLSGWKVKRRKKKLAEFEPELSAFFKIRDENYLVYQQYRQEQQEKLRAKMPDGIFSMEDFIKESEPRLTYKGLQEMAGIDPELDDDRDLVGVTGIFTRAKERWEYEMDEEYKREQEELFMEDF